MKDNVREEILSIQLDNLRDLRKVVERIARNEEATPEEIRAMASVAQIASSCATLMDA